MGGMENAYTQTPAEALKHFQVTEGKGLSEQQVKSLRDKYGKNGMLVQCETEAHDANAREQRCQKTRPRPFGSSSSSSSRTSSSSSCSARPPSLLCLPSSKTMRAGLRSSTRRWYVHRPNFSSTG